MCEILSWTVVGNCHFDKLNYSEELTCAPEWIVQYTNMMIFLPCYIEITKCLSDIILNQNPNHFIVVKFVGISQHYMTSCDAYTMKPLLSCNVHMMAQVDETLVTDNSTTDSFTYPNPTHPYPYPYH